MDYWTICLSIIAGILLLRYLFPSKVKIFQERGVPYIKPLPIVGNSLEMFLRRTSVNNFIMNVYTVFPNAKYFGFFDMSHPVLMIRDPELIKQIAVKNFEHFRNHRSFADVDPFFSKNLFALRDDKWRKMRMILTPAFTSSKIKAMFKLMTECAMDFAECLVEMSDAKEVNMKDVFTRYTNDVIATCAFGISINSLRDPKNKFYLYGREMTNFSNFRALKFFVLRDFPRIAKLLGVRFVDEHIMNYFSDIIKTIIKTRKAEGIVRPDMIQLMIESTEKDGVETEINVEDMISQAFIFFFAGFESTSALMCFATHKIALEPEVQEKLHDEIDKVLEDTDGKPTYDAINGMKYLNAVVSEVLRMYPTQVATDRVCTKDFELPPATPESQSFVVKEGMTINFMIYGYHHDSQHFNDPLTFNPDRFLENGKEIMNSVTYMPFGLGPRMCIGNRFALIEIKVVLFHLLARCNLKPCAKTTMKFKKGITMEVEGGFWLKIEARNKSPTAKT